MIPVIDLFAGPGGLGEGFSSVYDLYNNPIFEIKLSIEKEEDEHKTLELRSFFRKFRGHAPDEYYNLLKISDNKKRDVARLELYRNNKEVYKLASEEVMCAELGNIEFTDEVHKRIRKNLNSVDKWVLIGGPPCQAYSIAGRSRVGGIKEKDHRVYLYLEYLKILSQYHPAVFVMENVQGLLSAKLNEEKIFNKILSDLSRPSSVIQNSDSPEYKIYSLVKKDVQSNDDYLIKAEDYGIPQKRHRVILLGVRNDINISPECLQTKEPVSLGSVIGELPPVRSAINRIFIESQVIDYKKSFNYHSVVDSDQCWEEAINSYREEILSWNGITSDLRYIKAPSEGIGSEYIKFDQPTLNKNHSLYSWYSDERIGGIINHVSRSHLQQDLLRYLYLGICNDIYGTFPRTTDYINRNVKLLPNHKNILSGKFTDRFRVQDANNPATTITSHISKDGHYYIHYDYKQCRSLTVREAARIQTFPDNYLFCGSRTSQFHQVGNAVPPLLAFQIGQIVNNILKIK